MVEQIIPRELLYICDELFFTGTAAEITPIRSVDRIAVGTGRPGEMTLRLAAEFMGIVAGEVKDRHGWLHPVYPPAPAAATDAASAGHLRRDEELEAREELLAVAGQHDAAGAG